MKQKEDQGFTGGIHLHQGTGADRPADIIGSDETAEVVNVGSEGLKLLGMPACQIRGFEAAGIPFCFRTRFAIGRASRGLFIRGQLAAKIFLQFREQGF